MRDGSDRQVGERGQQRELTRGPQHSFVLKALEAVAAEGISAGVARERPEQGDRAEEGRCWEDAPTYLSLQLGRPALLPLEGIRRLPPISQLSRGGMPCPRLACDLPCQGPVLRAPAAVERLLLKALSLGFAPRLPLSRRMFFDQGLRPRSWLVLHVARFRTQGSNRKATGCTCAGAVWPPQSELPSLPHSEEAWKNNTPSPPNCLL